MVQPSHIRKAGEGVVNHGSTILLGVLFGLYPGEFIPLKYRQKAEESGKAWEIIYPESHSRQSHLKRHVATVHEKVRAFKCGTCGQCFGPTTSPLPMRRSGTRAIVEGVLGQGTGVTRGWSSSLKLSSCSSFVLITGNLNSSGLGVVPGMTWKIFQRPPLLSFPQSSGAERNRVIKTKKRTVPVENIFVTISQILD